MSDIQLLPPQPVKRIFESGRLSANERKCYLGNFSIGCLKHGGQTVGLAIESCCGSREDASHLFVTFQPAVSSTLVADGFSRSHGSDSTFQRNSWGLAVENCLQPVALFEVDRVSWLNRDFTFGEHFAKQLLAHESLLLSGQTEEVKFAPADPARNFNHLNFAGGHVDRSKSMGAENIHSANGLVTATR